MSAAHARPTAERPPMLPVPLLASVYLAAYLAASSLDLWTTAIATGGGATEGNPFAVSAGAYVATRAWVITAVGGLVLTVYVAFGLRNASRVSEEWLRRPVRSFVAGPSWNALSMLFFFPWSKAVLDRSPLHALSYGFAFVVLRLLAAANNVVIAWWGVAPLGSLVSAVSVRTSPAVGLLLVGGGLYVSLAVGISPSVARAIARRRRRDSAGTGYGERAP